MAQIFSKPLRILFIVEPKIRDKQNLIHSIINSRPDDRSYHFDIGDVETIVDVRNENVFVHSTKVCLKYIMDITL